MGLGQTVVLGVIAGATILLGMPVGRLRAPAPGLRLLLNAGAVGILLFLVWDVLSAAWEPIDAALAGVHAGTGGLGSAFGYGALFVVGLSVGLLSLIAYERWMATVARRAAPRPLNFGPGAAHAAELASPRLGVAGWSPARRLALLIAVGIGLHNFAEGLAIGQSSASGEVALATLLVIGFALHNATEGFGIVGPLGDVRPSWWWLAAAGLIGGAPTFIGAMVGFSVSSQALELAFYALAGGGVLYVIGEIWNGMRRYGHRTLGLLLLAAGFLVGVATDLVVSYGGG